MSFTPARAYERQRPRKSGITMSVRAPGSRATRPYVIFSMSAEFQQEHFGGEIDGQRFEVLIGRAQHEGTALFRVLGDTDIPTTSAVIAFRTGRGTARLNVAIWDLLDRESHKVAACMVVDPSTIEGAPPEGLLIRLPEFCQPQARKARIEADMPPLKPTPRREP